MTKRFSTLTALLALLALFALPACEVTTDQGQGIGGLCANDNECESGLTCLGGLCPVTGVGLNFCVPDEMCTADTCLSDEECVTKVSGSATCVPLDICPQPANAGAACGMDRECITGDCLTIKCDGGIETSVCISAMCANGACAVDESMWGDPENPDGCWCTPPDSCPAAPTE
jgi:hypothetical protein